MSLASVRWNGGSHVFHVPTDLNVRATFGSAAFLVDARRCVVRLDAAGAPSPPLVAGEAYVAYSGGSRELHRQLHALRGQLAAARNEQTKLRERLAKFEACTRAEMLAIAQMLHPSSATPPPSSITPPPSSITPPPSSANPPPSSTTPTPSSTTPPPSSTTPPPSSITPPPSSITPPPSSTTPPPSSTTPPPSSITPPPSSTTPPPSSTTPPPSSTTPPPPSDEWRGRPIGVLRSVWVEKNGTPRQGSVCAASVAELRIRVAGLNACHALEGLGSFSHVWLLFVFHKNGGAATKSKVQPPRLDGVKVGLFATRTPHRPNNLGLSLARLVAVRGDTLHLAAVDLIDGTPVMDVKPFVPFADSAVAPTVAPWLAVPPTPELSVDFTAAALAQLRALAPSLRLLRGEEQAKQAITEVLGGDPRSVHWRQHRTDLQYGFSIDTLNVVSRFEGTNVIVEQVQHIDLCDRSHIKGEAAMAAKAPAAGGAELATPDLLAAEASR
ncbi:hypothetical protein AB1Y20_016193 [Prymnesium parvum]|uniref:TsaA-like domain-containing protein n=1 Tax=Prymnesium parvum TaxID=97485 RepID=A0AB34IDF9_PRYPA